MFPKIVYVGIIGSTTAGYEDLYNRHRTIEHRLYVSHRLTEAPKNHLLAPFDSQAVEGLTYQMDSPIGLDLKLSKRALKEPPKTRLKQSPSV